MLALLLDSDRLIADYNGAILINTTFKFCFVFVNLGVFCSSTLCLASLLIVATKECRDRLINRCIVLQITLALLILLLMAKLWFSPLKLELSGSTGDNSNVWQEAIRDYNYQFEPDLNGLLPNNRLSGSASHQYQESLGEIQQQITPPPTTSSSAYKYRSAIDRLQRSLGCCGIWSPDDWSLMNNVGLLPPSCCKNPTGLLASGLLTNIGDNVRLLAANETFTGGFQAYRMEIFYCQTLSSNFVGCQRLIQDRTTRFIFNLRLTLLILTALLFSNVFYLCSLESWSRKPARAIHLNETLARRQPPRLVWASNSVVEGARGTRGRGGRGAHMNTLWHLQQAPPAYQHRGYHSPQSVGAQGGLAAGGAAHLTAAGHSEPPSLIANKCDLSENSDISVTA